MLPTENNHLLVTTELSGVLTARHVFVPGRVAMIDVPIEARYSPNVCVCVSYVKDGECTRVTRCLPFCEGQVPYHKSRPTSPNTSPETLLRIRSRRNSPTGVLRAVLRSALALWTRQSTASVLTVPVISGERSMAVAITRSILSMRPSSTARATPATSQSSLHQRADRISLQTSRTKRPNTPMPKSERTSAIRHSGRPTW